MASKTFDLDEQLEVTIYKRRGNRSLRLSVTGDGKVRLSIPTWTPYAVGLQFAKSRVGWIREQRKAPPTLQHGQAIGKAHHLEIIASPRVTRVTSRVVPGKVVVRRPEALHEGSAQVQQVASQASIRALRAQADKLLPERLQALADRHGFVYTDVRVKQLKSRWGSCDQSNHIVLNLFLMQLPWELIDYVLLHELTHTEHLNHGDAFWNRMKQLIPDLSARRKAMRTHQPQLAGSP